MYSIVQKLNNKQSAKVILGMIDLEHHTKRQENHVTIEKLSTAHAFHYIVLRAWPDQLWKSCYGWLHWFMNTYKSKHEITNRPSFSQKQVNILISKNQVLLILYLKHIKLHKLPWIETHENLIPTKLNNDTEKFYHYTCITTVNKTYLIIGQQVLSRFLVPYASFN